MNHNEWFPRNWIKSHGDNTLSFSCECLAQMCLVDGKFKAIRMIVDVKNVIYFGN